MIPDAEILTIMCETLSTLELGSPFVVKLNHRMLLDGIFEVCGVPAENFRPICSAVDKLDKLSWADVKKEMVETKGLAEEVADRIGEYVKLSGQPLELLLELLKNTTLTGNKRAAEALRLLGVLFEYLQAYGVLDRISFDLSLARGLDYYTGVIFEAILPEARVGSVSAGGRYDNLINMFSKNKKRQIPAVGFSVGVERIFTLLEMRAKKEGRVATRAADTLALVATSYGATLLDRMRILRELWEAGIPAETIGQPKPKMKRQLDFAEQNSIPLCVLVGEDELNANLVRCLPGGGDGGVCTCECVCVCMLHSLLLCLPCVDMCWAFVVAIGPVSLMSVHSVQVSIKDLRAPRDSKRKQFTVPRAEVASTLIRYQSSVRNGNTHEEAMLDLA
jgi:histidyl-tRNA synthetase